MKIWGSEGKYEVSVRCLKNKSMLFILFLKIINRSA